MMLGDLMRPEVLSATARLNTDGRGLKKILRTSPATTEAKTEDTF